MTNLSTSFENPRVLGSIIRRQRLTLRANGKAVVQTPSALVRVRAPLFKETSLRAGFLLSGIRTLHRTPFDYSPLAAHPTGQRQSRCSNAFGVSPSPGTTI